MVPKFVKKSLLQKETIGEVLRKKRKELGISLKDAETSTKIRVKYLDALENDNWKKIPNNVYVKGFLKNYASFLGFNPKNILDLYKKGRGIEKNVKKASSKTKTLKPKKTPKVIITPKTIIVGIVSLAILSIILYITWQYRIFTAPPKLEVYSPENNINLDINSIFVSGKTDSGADIFINNVLIGSDSEGNFKEKVSLQNGINIIKISAKNKMGKETKIDKTVMVNLKEISIGPQEPTTPTAIKGIIIKIQIGDSPAWLQIKEGDKELYQGIMLPGATQTFKADEKISIITGNAKSTRVILSNEKVIEKDLGFLSDVAETKEVEYTKDMKIE